MQASLYTGSNIAQPIEYGIYGHQTPGEIADDRKPDIATSPSLDEEPIQSPLQQSMKEAESRSQNRSPERGKEQSQDRDR